ncbi:MAG: PRC-barrel domain-containing protein [Nitrolancea sp.]
MEIKLGKSVTSSNGKHVGDVDSLVVDYNTKDVMSVIVRSGALFGTDRIIPVESFDRVDDDGTIHLNLTDEEAKEHEEFVQQKYTAANPGDYPYTDEAWVSGTGQPSVFWAYGTAPMGYSSRAPFFSEAPVDPPEVEVKTNLPERSVRIDHGTDVVGSDGKKLGTVDEVDYAEDGEIDGFVVKAGFLFHHDIRIPSDWINEVNGDLVTLTVTSDQAEGSHSG